MAPSSSSSLTLHLAPSRRSTFHKTRKGANKVLNWPYPLTAAAAKNSSIHPDRLVQAGFYCTPTPDDPTVTTCYLCDVVVGEWEEGEDPLYRHSAAADEVGLSCAWLTVQQASWGEKGLEGRGKKEDWSQYWGEDGEMHPRGEVMRRAREETFRLGWPHEGVKGVPTRSEIAAAGWVFRPGNAEDSADQCACIYCGRIIEGWEKDDDPVALHKRKVGLKCPFFLAPSPSSSSAAPAPKSSSSRAAPPATEPESEAEVAPEPPKTAKRGKKASTASTLSSASSRKTGRGKKTAQLEEEVVEEEQDEEAQMADAPEEAEGDEEEEAPVKKPRSKAKTAAKKGRTTTASVASTSTRSRRGATPAPSEADEPEEMPILKKSTRSRANTTSAAPSSSSVLSKSTRSRAAPKTEIDVVVEIETPAPPKSKKGKKAAPAPEPELQPEPKPQGEETDEDDAPAPGPLEADESITQLAFIANAALEAEQVEEVAPAPSKPKRAASVKKEKGAAGKGKKALSSQVEAFEGESAPVPQMIPPPAPVASAPPPISVAAANAIPPASTVRTPLSPVMSPVSPTSASGSSSRAIRPLPSKGRSPSSGSLKAAANGNNTPLEPVPPVPSLPAPVVPAPAPPPSAVTTPIDPTAPFSAPSNPFTPNSPSLFALLPPPTPSELTSLSVGEWFTLCGKRLHERYASEAWRMRDELEARVEAGRVRLGEMVLEAREREERGEREERAAREKEEVRKREKRERKRVEKATPGKGRAKVGGAAAGIEGSARKIR
ncbi:hypothetical protein JCM11641_005711 [Rhodosporidiobolus odoratus]